MRAPPWLTAPLLAGLAVGLVPWAFEVDIWAPLDRPEALLVTLGGALVPGSAALARFDPEDRVHRLLGAVSCLLGASVTFLAAAWWLG
ncbi:MAG: hypothetical protein R3185_05515 [Candidatus Thermoplasmatota archaeon]|nr:hypothetical protein [Candidatus Thermoplasmatota archaeon]